MQSRCSEKSIEYLRYIIEANKQVNLTAITDWDKALILHLEDSLAALPTITGLLGGMENPHILDIGSGGGFPAIPIALETGMRTTLVESIKKKTAIVQKFLDREQLCDYIEVVAQRAEEAALTYAGSIDLITARALSELPVLVELASPFLKIGGYLVTYKAKPEEAEISRGMSAAKQVGLDFVAREDYVLSDNETHRALFIYKKTGKAKLKLPRRNGVAQKHPIA